MISREVVKRLIHNRDWQALEAHIREALDSLDTLAGIDFADEKAAAIEGRARALAREKLSAVLKPFDDLFELGGSDSAKDRREDTGLE